MGDNMKINGRQSNEMILQELGDRIQKRRIAMAITQKEIAVESGISERTIINAEGGENISLKHLIGILRVLRITENLNLLIEENRTDPIEMMTLGHQRKRVSKSESKKNSPWKWGDEK